MLSLTLPLVPCFHVFEVLFSIMITSFGEERAGLYVSHAFAVLSCICLFLFLLVSGMGCGILALPRLFI